MKLNEYQELAARTANDEVMTDPMYTAIGMAEEAGEYGGKVKHEVYHKWPEDRDGKLKELGDLLWYLTMAAKMQGFTLQEVAEANLRKLQKRYPEGFSEEASWNREEHQTNGQA